MLLSSNFTPAESVAVAFNQKTQYDRIWQGYLFIILGPLLLPIPTLSDMDSRGQCCSSAARPHIAGGPRLNEWVSKLLCALVHACLDHQPQFFLTFLTK